MSKAWEDSVGDLFADIDKLEGKKKPVKKQEKPTSKTKADEPVEKPVKKASAKPEFRSGLGEVTSSRVQAQRALGKKPTMAGQYQRRSYTFRPEQLEAIEEVAAYLGLSQNDLMRWFVDMGLEAVSDGVKPPVAEVVRHRYDPTAWS